MGTADLSPPNLLRTAWEAFSRRPGFMIAIWVVATLIESGGSADPDQGAIGSLLLVVAFVFSGPITGGYDLATARLLRGYETVVFSDMFAGLEKFAGLFVVYLLYMFATLIGLVFLIVPGIIIGLAFWPAFLIVMEDDRSAVDALRDAWDLTTGHKLDLFLLLIVSTVLYLVGALAFGVELLVAGPIVQLAWVSAYEEMREARRVEIERYAPPAI